MNKELVFVKDMFDKIAPRYDFLNRLLSLRQDTMWRRQMVDAAKLSKGDTILDVACGTCDVALEASSRLKDQAQIIGLDFSHGMLKLGQSKLQRLGNSAIQLVNGNALALPFGKKWVDAVFIAFGIRNIMDRQGALEEFHRVLKPGGRVVVLELTTPEKGLLRQIYLSYFQKILPRIGAYFSKDNDAYSYLPESVLKFPSASNFARLMKSAGFESVRFKPMTFGIVTLFVGRKP
ncbi:MAG: bifunctional demethylmenaquinone methyltransferase/2-methoxy-6-polyprenyl-1,4-benzoquinol methylase UbiE [Desulfobacterales bacterium]|nr:bifunctional demethylmenaquinone methyltransferase/2-methoxy-6-polyprenyl-1,4-benzoquinol methylase UbiE [Desulfobacterales bacterium]